MTTAETPAGATTVDTDALVYNGRLGVIALVGGVIGAGAGIIYGSPVIAALAIVVLIGMAGIVFACR